MGFAERGEDFKQLVGDFRCNTGAGVLDFGDDFLFVAVKAQKNRAAVEHHVGGVVDEVGENAAEAARIERDEDGGRFVLHFDARILEFRFGAEVGD